MTDAAHRRRGERAAADPAQTAAAGPAQVQAPPQVHLPAGVLAAHRAAVAALRGEYAALPPGAPVRLAKRTSNLFRFRDPLPGRPDPPACRASRGCWPGGLDVSAFGHVLHVDPRARTAVVGGMTTYEDLVDATLPARPDAAGACRSSRRSPWAARSPASASSPPRCATACRTSRSLEMEILTGDGRVVTATAGRRARRPVPRLPELLRHPRLRALRSPSSWSRSSRTCTCGTSGSTAPKRAWRRSARSPRDGSYARSPGRLRRRHRVQPGRDLPHGRRATARPRPGVSDYTGQQHLLPVASAARARTS